MRGARSRGCGAVRSGGCCIVVRRGGGETNATKRSAVGANIIIEPEQPHSRTRTEAVNTCMKILSVRCLAACSALVWVLTF